MTERLDVNASEPQASAGVDLRGFVHSLDALRRQSIWKLDQLQLQRAQSLQLLQHKQAALDTAKRAYDAAHQAAGHAVQGLVDPRQHAGNLAYLVRMQQEMAHQQSELAAVRTHHGAVHKRYLQQHQRMEGLERHRTHAMQDYAAQWLRQQAVDADRDWMAGFSVKAAQAKERLEMLEGISP